MKRQPSLFEDASLETPRPFLKSVAQAYHDNFDDLSEFCFVFPNKRAGTFFLRHLHDASDDRTRVAPRVTSITDFVAELSGHDVASRIDLLFRLFNIYKEQKGDIADFDAFRNWGETLISDFSEVDQYNVDADSLFKNVKDYREIASSFLTPEQVEIIHRYFGYAPGLKEVERFWKNMTPPSDIKTKFLLLWQQMAPLYHALNKNLHADRLCTSGGAYRLALQRLETHGRRILPWKKVVMVGFNALSTTEALIFDTLKGLDAEPGVKGKYAEFFWDGTGDVLKNERNDAASFLKFNRENFRQPEWADEWMRESDTDGMPAKLTAIASPSNSAQGKIAGELIEKLFRGDDKEAEGEGREEVKEARVAVVLPDENMLMPLLYALPKKMKVNLTMGYPLRSTSVMAFIHHLKRVRATERRAGDDLAFYHEDLRGLLSHPYMHSLIGSKTVSEINGYMNLRRKMTLTLSELRGFSEQAAELLRPLPAQVTTQGIIDYIDRTMETIAAHLDSAAGGMVKTRLDRDHISIYRKGLRRLANACAEHCIEMGTDGVFAMADQLVGSEPVTFKGEPLEGLQVMGLLETRALDFDRLVILSMNDRVMPRKASARTFIPDALRHGYGMPYSNYREDLFSYYFYRMISRAREVTMIYDARASSGMRSGGMSRYLMQLRYLYAKDRIKFENRKFDLNPGKLAPEDVIKTPAVMEQLRQFTVRGSRRNFSASALRNYFTCPVKFYYENVVGLRTDDEPSPYLDAIGVGNVLHEVMFHLYFPEGKRKIYLKEPIVMERKDIEAMLGDRERIFRLVTESVNRLHFHLPDDQLTTPLEGAAERVGRQIAGQVCDVLAYDLTLAPFRLAGGEISGLVEWSLPGTDRKVNMKYAIDRLDIITLPDGTQTCRIVDYKTGAAHVKASSMDAIFDGSDDAKNFFQLMLYANLMNRDRGTDHAVRLAIYQVSELGKGGETLPSVGEAAEPGKRATYKDLASHLDRNEEFLERTDEILSDIFNSDVPFAPADDDKKCQYCNLAHLCGRGH